MRPRMTLRCLTRRGSSIGSGPRGGRGRDGLRGARGRDVATVDPDLHADPAVGRVGVHLAVADVGAERPERDATLAVPLAAAHLGAAEAAGDHDLDALGAGLHRPLDGLLHRLLEGDSPAQLLADVGRDEVRVELGLADLLDLQLDLALRERADLLAEDLDVLAALADDDARLGGVDGDRDLAEVALDLEAADAGVGEPLVDELADGHVLLEEVRVLLVVVPLRGPRARHPEPEPVRVDLVTHVAQPSRSPTVTVMCVTPLWIGKARPWARGRHRLIVGPLSARAS